MVNTSIRLEEGMLNEIKGIASKEDRKYNHMVRILLREALENRPDIGKEFLKQLDNE